MASHSKTNKTELFVCDCTTRFWSRT